MISANDTYKYGSMFECCEPDRESATKSAAFADHNAQRHTHVVRSLRKADENPFYLDTKIVKMTTNR